MAITVVCECGHTVKTYDHYAGKLSRCPKCRRSLRIPAAEPSIISPKVEAVAAVDEGPAFTEWQPPVIDEPEPISLPDVAEVAPLPRLTAPAVEEKEPVEETDDRAEFRRQFFGLWVCQMAFRFVGQLTIVLLAVGLVVILSLMAFGIVLTLINGETKDAAAGWFFSMAMLVWLAPTWIGTFIAACGMLASAELLTAAGWWFFRQRIGGNGPF